MTTVYNPVLTLVPPTTDARLSSCKAAYDNFARTLHVMLTDENTIKQEKCPRAYNVLQANQVQSTGFDLLVKIVFSLSPHLGGTSTPVEDIVQSINI